MVTGGRCAQHMARGCLGSRMVPADYCLYLPLFYQHPIARWPRPCVDDHSLAPSAALANVSVMAAVIIAWKPTHEMGFEKINSLDWRRALHLGGGCETYLERVLVGYSFLTGERWYDLCITGVHLFLGEQKLVVDGDVCICKGTQPDQLSRSHGALLLCAAWTPKTGKVEQKLQPGGVLN